MKAARLLDNKLKVLGIERHETKGVWGKGASELDHLHFYASTKPQWFTVTTKKQARLRQMTGKL